MRSIFVVLALSAFVPSANAIAAKHKLFPDEVLRAGGDSTFPEQFGESPFWPGEAGRGYRQRIRLFIGGHTTASWVIRIDEKKNGSLRGYFARHNGEGIVAERWFSVSKKDFGELDDLIGRARIWRIYPEFFAEREGTICIDGETVILERVNVEGYRYSEGNAQCTLADPQLAVVAKLMEIARQPRLERLLE